MKRRRPLSILALTAAFVAGGLSPAVAVPVPEKRGHHDKDRDPSADDGGEGDSKKCVGFIALCGATITVPPTPLTPSPK